MLPWLVWLTVTIYDVRRVAIIGKSIIKRRFIIVQPNPLRVPEGTIYPATGRGVPYLRVVPSEVQYQTDLYPQNPNLVYLEYKTSIML